MAGGHDAETTHVGFDVVEEVEDLGLQHLRGMAPWRPIPVPLDVGGCACRVYVADRFGELQVVPYDLPQNVENSRVSARSRNRSSNCQISIITWAAAPRP